MKKKLTYNYILRVIFLICLLATSASFILQYGYNFNPCPLCILQRVAVIITGLAALLLLLIPQKWIIKYISLIFILIPSIFGMVTALRQLYIQSLPPDKVPSCGPGFDYLIANNTYFNALQKIFSGSGECAIAEKIFYLPLPLWSLITFLIIVLLAIGGIIITQNKSCF